MKFEKIKNIEIKEEPLKLYQAIHTVKGQNNDTQYEKKICDYYESKFKEVLKVLNFNTSEHGIIKIHSVKEVENKYKIVKRTVEIYDLIYNKMARGSDFSQFDYKMSYGLNINSPDYLVYLDSVEEIIKALPEFSAAISTKLIKSPLLVLEYLTDFNNEFQLDGSIDILVNELVRLQVNNPNANTDTIINKLADNTNAYSLYNGKDYIKVLTQYLENPKRDSYSINNLLNIAKSKVDNRKNAIISAQAVLEKILDKYGKALKNPVDKHNTSNNTSTSRRNTVSESNSTNYVAPLNDNAKSLIIGVVCWILLGAGLIVLFLFTYKPIINAFSQCHWLNNWKKFWSTSVYIILNGLFDIGIMFAIFFIFIDQTFFPDWCTEHVAIPKGFPTFVTLFITYFADLSGSRIALCPVPFKIFGTGCIILSLFLEFYVDIRNSNDNLILDSGMYLFSNAFCFLPVLMVFGFAFVYPTFYPFTLWLHAILIIIVLSIGFIAAIGDSLYF